MTSPSREHDVRILDQFTRQADPFADLAGLAPRALMDLIVRAARLDLQQQVIDVACGPGLVAVALAARAGRVVGVDVVPAMLARARLEARAAGRDNVSFQRADARALPYDAGAFERAVTRFSFHHLQDPARVLREMVRVTKPSGLVIVIDATPAPGQRAAFDEMERLRDPSHTAALTRDELEHLFVRAGLALEESTSFALRTDLERQLAAAFPRPGGADRVRALFERDLCDGVDRMGLCPSRKDGRVRFAYPCSIVVGRKS